MPKVTQEVLSAFGTAVERARSLKGWTLDQLSGEMDGTSGKSFLSAIENGKRSISTRTVGRLIKALDLDEGWIDQFTGSEVTPEAEQTRDDREADQLVDIAQREGQTDRLRDEGITEKAIIRLAQRIARDTAEVGQAWLELQNAMDIAVRVQQEGRVTSNHGDFVGEVLKRVAAYAAEGEFAQASAAIVEALAEEDAAHQARKSRLLDSGIEIAKLARDGSGVAKLLVQRIDIEAGGRAEFEQLRSQQYYYYVMGRDYGSALDLIISVQLAHFMLDRSNSEEQRGAALNDLGLALQTLGALEGGTTRLQQAISTYKHSLKVYTRERAPIGWAIAQMNLGNAQLALAERENGTARLEQAIEAYDNARIYLTREQVPLEWALVQMNLGNALLALGRRESGGTRLEQAIEAYNRALQVRTREREPQGWAITELNLGNALLTLATRNGSTTQLKQAIEAYQNALKELSREQVPLDWAMTQMNLGNALSSFVERESGVARLEQAIKAYQNALEEFTRERVPLDWAMLHGNLANLKRALFEKSLDPAHLDQALHHAAAAKETFQTAGASHYTSKIDTIIERINSLND
ncbi:Exodeoxyribonuclease 7 small subunit [Roseovarius albus]|uniref:Exodeoxyribonuclease 7 small subunit n=1 Tax=Roseovarius albus TaxID=1247867 RepID=A0A1X6YMU4_9RHOB|nr:helix-turn-helix domain-containing protein [Roseovarius albus]SLN26079.1 Exodeoxyribonuclease 7 small subunit [Roseovarius albus]